MVLVRIKDRRYKNGYSIKFFHKKEIDNEIVDFVLKNPRAYWVESYGEFYRSREEFLSKFNQL